MSLCIKSFNKRNEEKTLIHSDSVEFLRQVKKINFNEREIFINEYSKKKDPNLFFDYYLRSVEQKLNELGNKEKIFCINFEKFEKIFDQINNFLLKNNIDLFEDKNIFYNLIDKNRLSHNSKPNYLKKFIKW